MSFTLKHPYDFDPSYSKPVAYFCMEFAIHQPLKIYAGGLGYLAGSHLRSAFQMKQNLVAVGILWKYGYYDQIRKSDQTMDILFQEKVYGFLQHTGIKYKIKVSNHDVWVAVYYLPPSVFNTAPLFLLSTDLHENDYLAKTICHRLYDPNPETKIAASILLGVGGVKLFEHLSWKPDVYHLNESHGLPAAFYLYNKFKHIADVKQRVVFTSHTPEEGGNPVHNLQQLERMSFFSGVPLTEVKALTGTENDMLNYTVSLLRLSRVANGVSKLHHNTMMNMWSSYPQICAMLSITNAQNLEYWGDAKMYEAVRMTNMPELKNLKTQGKRSLFDLVADQNGEILDPHLLTIVFAKRFAGYKRPDLLLRDTERFLALITNKERPIQIIWAGKPYPSDYAAIGVFDKIVNLCKQHPNCSIVTNYELRQSKLLKSGADVWLNVPRFGHEASGTSGMSAAMNGAINVSIADGWVPEFARDKANCFIIPHASQNMSDFERDDLDAANLYNLLENEVIPLYYDYPERWAEMQMHSMNDVVPQFDSNRMAAEYYELLYSQTMAE
jgi:glycogen phosphorylase